MNSPGEYSDGERTLLLSVAYRSIEHGVENGTPLRVTLGDFAAHLCEKRACFVTLWRSGDLRGCTGVVVARAPLVTCVAEHAFTSAFRDGRFPMLTPDELPELEISISVLSVPEVMTFSDEADLVSKVRPGIDGLILSEGGMLATLLPSVWETVGDPALFLRQLKRKAGLPPRYWSTTIEVSRYTTEQF